MEPVNWHLSNTIYHLKPWSCHDPNNELIIMICYKYWQIMHAVVHVSFAYIGKQKNCGAHCPISSASYTLSPKISPSPRNLTPPGQLPSYPICKLQFYSPSSSSAILHPLLGLCGGSWWPLQSVGPKITNINTPPSYPPCQCKILHLLANLGTCQCFQWSPFHQKSRKVTLKVRGA